MGACRVRDGTSTMLTLRGLDGQVVSEVTFDGSSWSWSKDYVYRDGLLLSSVSVAQGLRHYALDQLGSPRLVTNRCGEQVRLFAMNPFGKDPDATTQDAERMRFTIHERDLGDTTKSLDDLDAMHARSYMPFLGRFTSVDLLRGDPHSPQSFNLFAYVQGNPLNFLDPSGLDDIIPYRLKDYVSVFANFFNFGPNTFPIGVPGAPPPAVGSSGFGAGVGSGETAEPQNPCAAHGFAAGWIYGGNVDLGDLREGGSAQLSLGGGSFWNRNTGFSQAVFATGAAVAYTDAYGSRTNLTATPSQMVDGTTVSPQVGGVYGGAGPIFFFGNMGSGQQISGPMHTRAVSVGFGGWRAITFSLATAGRTWMFTIGPPTSLVVPGSAPGLGMSFTSLVTDTNLLYTSNRGGC